MQKQNWCLVGLSVFIVLQVTTILLVLTSRPATTVIRDRLDTVVVMGFGEPRSKNLSSCLRSVNVYSQTYSSSRNCADLDWRIEPGSSAAIWAWASNSRDANIAVPGKSLSFEVVDRDGVVVPPDYGTIAPAAVVTGDDGFNVEDVVFNGVRPGVYRVRVIYTDRMARSFSYSPNIIVQSE